MKLVVVSHPCITPVNQDIFARVQARTGWEVTVVLPSSWTTEYGARRAERWPAFEGGLVSLPVALSGNIPLHFYIARTSRQLRALRPDVLYLHNEPYAVSTYQLSRAAQGLGDVPVGFYSAQNLAKRYPWPVSRWERRVYAHARFALPVSSEVADTLRAKGYRGRIDVVPLSVDTERLHPPAGPAYRNGPPFVAGYVGRLAAEKGVDTLLEALSLLEDQDMCAVIAGDGPARGSLEEAAGSLGVRERIRWEGYVPHDAVAKVYRRMDVLVVPSKTVPRWKEQFGRVVVEALACGVPVIASDSGQLPALMAETGGGWTFPEGDASTLAARLSHARRSPDEARERATRGRRVVERVFSADAVADHFAHVIQDVVSSK